VVRRWFDPSPSECGSGMDGGARSGGNRPDGRRRLGREVEDAGLTDRWAHLSVRGEATGRLGQKGREEVGRGWARKRREEAGPKLLLGLKSKRVKRKINFN
jgi:hypothetical protein